MKTRATGTDRDTWIGKIRLLKTLLEAFPWVHPERHVVELRPRPGVEETRIVLTPDATLVVRSHDDGIWDIRFDIRGAQGRTVRTARDPSDNFAAAFAGFVLNTVRRRANAAWITAPVFPVAIVAGRGLLMPLPRRMSTPGTPDRIFPPGSEVVFNHDFTAILFPARTEPGGKTLPPFWAHVEDVALFRTGIVVDTGRSLSVKNLLERERLEPSQ